jgi:uncharacterized membrane protein
MKCWGLGCGMCWQACYSCCTPSGPSRLCPVFPISSSVYTSAHFTVCALYPTLIALGFLALCLLVMRIEYQPWLMSLKHHVDAGLVRNAENARLILGTLFGGIMTLMVFSFSMVMVVLNNASASLSPRVIPGLINDKGHQKTLGFYLGTILYSLLLITSIEQNSSTRAPSLGVLISLGLGIACVGLFVHFIHSISRSIQVEYILNNLYHDTRGPEETRRPRS